MRSDIQFLRGIAVLTVVLYHLKLLFVSGGFLGVDVFFVISGFLITSVILRGLDSGSFSFAGFYTRRAKRLLPAAYSTLLLCTLLSYQFLTQGQWTDYIEQLFAAITFTANIVLPFQSGYFEEAAEAKPLLHIWSLSLEEQYYLLLPLLIFLTPKAWRGWLFSISIVASLALCIYFISFSVYYWRLPSLNYSELAFYSLPTRAWELLSGSLLAWLMLQYPAINIPINLKRIALAILLATISYRIDETHPRGDALIVVIATTLMIAGKDNWLPNNLLTKAIQKVGDWSYSLYLLHWPLIVFATAGFLGDVPTSAKLLILALSLIAAFLQFQFVEEPFRRTYLLSQRSSLKWLSAATALLFACVAPAIAYKFTNSEVDTPNFEILRKANTGLSNRCEAEEGGFFKYPDDCSTSQSPIVAVWGDSFAMHLVPGLVTDSSIGGTLVQLTMGSCPPILETARITTRESKSWPQQCIQHNEQSFSYILNSNSIKAVIISADFGDFISKSGLKIIQDGAHKTNEPEFTKNRLIETIRQLQDANKEIVLVGPIPTTGINAGECLERIHSGLKVFGRSSCEFSYSDVKKSQEGTVNTINEIARQTRSEVFLFDSALCQKNICRVKIGKTYLYRDATHLSVSGSEYLIPKTNLPELVKALIPSPPSASITPVRMITHE